ncbi:MAG: RNA methyltransferase [Bacilli bacterium]|nr:RNA methyltransferase [Bacilli bacterium]
MLYTSTSNQKIKDIKKLHSKKYRDSNNMFIVETLNLVMEAYKEGYLLELYTKEGAKSLDIPTNYVSDNVMRYLSNLENPSDYLAVCKKIENKIIGNRIVILDNIQNPGNLGTIIRSCVAFNIDTLVLSSNNVDLYNDKTVRSSEGMLFKLNIITCDIVKFIKELKDKDYTIYGTKVDNGTSLKDINVEPKYAIVMGNEGNGMSNIVSSLCDKFIYIDMNSKCESLNVSIATSIILYEFNK